jgi:iron complex outermembrane recepter protein
VKFPWLHSVKGMCSLNEEFTSADGRIAATMGRFLFRAWLMILGGLPVWHLADAQEASFLTDLAMLDLEDLMNIEVTLASRKEEKLIETAAAVFVLTQEDIHRSGATGIPDALRLVPGLQVARIDASKWAITPRESHFRFANKLLVLVDGRSVYTPLFSGVFWETQDLVLEDIEQIEVIRGPGATLWGANAVNGVINIITRDASQTHGTLVTGGGGTEERVFGVMRHGGRLGDRGNYRIYGKYFERDASVDWSGETAHDRWSGRRGGFRADWVLGGAGELTLQGELYGVELSNQLLIFEPEPPFPQKTVDIVRLSGGHLLGHWRRRLSATADLALQLYFDRTSHRERFLGQRHHTYDIDFQHHFGWREQHDLVWGAWARLVDDDLDNSFMAGFAPEKRRLFHYSLFTQDDIAFFDGRLRLLLGSKFEHNPYTGLETQPNLRLLWSSPERYAFWGAVSRAVRTPSRSERDARLVLDAVPSEQLPVGAEPVLFVGEGREEVESEERTALEAGCRWRTNSRLFVDVAVFLHLLDKQAGITLGRPVSQPSPLGAIIPVLLENRRSGEDYGFEALADWELRSDWRLRATYTYLGKRRNTALTALLDSDYSRHNLSLRSQADLPGQWTLDGTVRYVSALTQTDVGAYATLDLRVAWKLREGIELALVGQNLLESHHAETIAKVIDYQPTQVQRGVYAEIVLEF